MTDRCLRVPAPLILDDSAGAGPLVRLRMVRELATIKSDLGTLGDDKLATLKRLKLVARANQIRIAIGAKPIPPAGADSPATTTTRAQTGQFYEFDPNRKPAQRKRDNADAMAILRDIDAGKVDPASLTGEQKTALAKYSGTGGALIGADGKKGSAYEYYTPKPIAEGIWRLLSDLGFSGGKVLDPCAGVGIFGATAPQSAVIDAVELNETSGRINGLVNGGPGYVATVSPFERVAAATPDGTYDAVVTNVPFGGVADRGGNQLLDPRYQKEPLQNYFILRSLEKLRPGGLAVFITPPRCVSGKGGKEEELRVRASYLAEFLGAYRLPNSVFGTAQADTMTDVIAFRKYGADAAERIAELREQAPQTLIDGNVLWQEFIGGQYFAGEGKRFVLGEFVPKDPAKFRDVDRVITKSPIGEIAQMLRKFPDSRVDWAALNAPPTMPVMYREGDTLTQGGQTLQMTGGRWVALAATERDTSDGEMLAKLASPLSAFEAGVDWAAASGLCERMVKASQAMDIPGWLASSGQALARLDGSARSEYWRIGVIGMAVAQVLQERLADEAGTNFLAEYPALSEAMQRSAAAAKKRPAALGSPIREGLTALTTHYRKATGFSGVWRGDVQTQAPKVETTADGSFEGLRYQTKSAWAGIDVARAIFGEDFDPISDPEWCVSADGQRVTRADDYYVGNYADLIKRIDRDIAEAPDGAVKDKLLRMKLDADQRVERLDVSKFTFDLFSPHVTLEEKAEFMRRFVHQSAVVVFDEKTSKKRVDIDIKGSNLTDREKLLNRVGDYMKNGTITLGGTKLGMDDAAAIRELRRMVNTANEQFNGWVRSNREIMGRLEAAAADPARLRFREVDDSTPLPIPGLNPEWKLHGYQNAFIRKQGRQFGGGNGDDVGLGKTTQGLVAAHYAQAIGVKKKTAFIVPNSVLSKWRAEAGKTFANTDDCLFIGLRTAKDGKVVVKSSDYDADLTTVMENRHSKIFMTFEAFERLRLRDDSIDRYEAYLRSVDDSFAEQEDKKADERAKGKAAGAMQVLREKSGGAPFLEDMGIDSLVIDEAHGFKNSADTVNFKAAKFLSLSPSAKRGIDMQAKAWIIRGGSPLKDGVLVLSATPITNSPLEVYSMLSLAVGRERVNDACLGIRGADDFMNMMCQIENQDDMTMDGILRPVDVFVGLKNVGVLRSAIRDVFTIRDAEDVGAQIVVPDGMEKQVGVDLPGEVVDRLQLYKGAFRYAIDNLTGATDNRGDHDAYEAVAKHFGEPLALIGHPFNLINKMTLLIADPELDQRATFYSFDAGEIDKAQAAVKAFNALKIVEERKRPGPHTDEDAIFGQRIIKEGEDESVLIKVQVRAKIEGGRVVIDSMDPDAQSRFEEAADKSGLALDVTVPPKLAAMLENFQNEQASPRGVDASGQKTSVVRQIVFCDILPMHNKIKRVLTQRAGVPAGAIAVITGRTNNTPDEILAVQDGFNAPGEDNKYRTVIANEKAEVGIDLQRGTQAIHHLTIGWTPDSIHQRNGRGVRQGNQTEFVNVYHYDADGTFDTSKRVMVGKKSDWIGALMDDAGGDTVAVSGGLSREQMEALIDAVGDADAVRQIEERVAASETAARAASNRARQMVNIDTIRKQSAYLASNQSPAGLVIGKVQSLWAMQKQADKLRVSLRNPKAKEAAIQRMQGALDALADQMASVRRQIVESTTITRRYGQTEANPLDAIFEHVATLKRDHENAIAEIMQGNRYPGYTVAVHEDSEIQREWQSEVDMASAMINEAKAAFSRQAKQAGAYPDSVLSAIDNGTFYIDKGVPYTTGTLIQTEDGPGVCKVSKGGVLVVTGIDNAGQYNRYSLNEADASGPRYPGTPEHAAMLDECARREDEANADGGTSNTYSDVIPEVAQRRKVAPMAEYFAHDKTLPPPHFPYLITPDDADGSALLTRIFEAQKSVIRGWKGKRFLVDADTPLGDVSYRDRMPKRTRALIEYAKAHGLQGSIEDFGGAIMISGAPGWANEGAMKAAFEGAIPEGEVAVEQALKKALQESLPWLESLGGRPADLLPPSVARAYADAANRARHAEAGDDPPIANAGQGSPEDAVGVKGETWRWKEQIKAAARAAGGGKFRWDGIAAQWNIRRSAWDYLISQSPSAANDLQLTTASKRV